MILKVSRHKFGIQSLLLLIVVGGVFLSSGLFLSQSLRINSDWTRVTGKVIDVVSSSNDDSTLYSPIVEYSVNNQTYTITSNISSSGYPTVGSEIGVAYNPSDPEQAVVVPDKGLSLILLLFPTVGVFILILAPILFIRSLRRSQKIKQLQQHGEKLEGVLTDLIKTSQNDRDKTYNIVVSAADKHGVVHNYVSDPLVGVGAVAMADFRNNPIPIDVYVDRSNPQNFYVDVSDIPNLTPQRITELIHSATIGKNDIK